MAKLKDFFSDVYEGIYFISKKHEHTTDQSTVNQRFFASFFLYYMSILTIVIAFISTNYGPIRRKPSFLEAIFYTLGIYIFIYKFLIYPMINKGNIGDNIDFTIKKKKMKTALFVQVGGFICFFAVFATLYILYKN